MNTIVKYTLRMISVRNIHKFNTFIQNTVTRTVSHPFIHENAIALLSYRWEQFGNTRDRFIAKDAGRVLPTRTNLFSRPLYFPNLGGVYSDLSNVRYLTKLSFLTSRVSVAWKIKIKAGIETFAAHKEPVNKLPCARPRKSARQGDEFQSNWKYRRFF